MAMSNVRKHAKLAYDMGYRMSPTGDVIGLKGSPLSFRTTGTPPWLYYTFSIGPKGDTTKSVPVHMLAAYQKFGDEWLFSDLVVRHLNGVSTDNSLDNIEIGTDSDNMFDIPSPIRTHKSVVAARTLRNITYEDAEDIRIKKASGVTLKQLCAEYGVSKSAMSYIVNKKTYNTYE